MMLYIRICIRSLYIWTLYTSFHNNCFSTPFVVHGVCGDPQPGLPSASLSTVEWFPESFLNFFIDICSRVPSPNFDVEDNCLRQAAWVSLIDAEDIFPWWTFLCWYQVAILPPFQAVFVRTAWRNAPRPSPWTGPTFVRWKNTKHTQTQNRKTRIHNRN